MLAYLFFFHVPFIIQIFAKDKFLSLICLLSCLVITCISAFEEVVKIRSRVGGAKQGMMAWFNIAAALLITLFFALRTVRVL